MNSVPKFYGKIYKGFDRSMSVISYFRSFCLALECVVLMSCSLTEAPTFLATTSFKSVLSFSGS